MDKANKMATYFGTGSRLSQLRHMGNDDGLDYPTINFQIPKNVTRISAEHGLLYSEMRINHLV